MIAPMKRFILVLLGKDAHDAPLHLKKLGIAHLEKFESSGKTCADLEILLKKGRGALAILTSSSDKKVSSRREASLSASALIEKTLAVSAEIATLQDSVSDIRREIERIGVWGNFSPELLDSLRESGLHIRLLEGSPAQMKNLPEETDYIRLPAPKGRVRIALINDDRPLPEFMEFGLPAKSLSAFEKEAQGLRAKITENKNELLGFAAGKELVEREIAKLESALTIERLRAGMPSQESLRYLSGYVPARDSGRLKALAAERGWAIALDDPSPDELPPTKVENNPVVRMMQPVFDFLGTVPNYREYDISGWFLVFFSIYFAMIFGDGGYGLIMLSGAVAMFVKSRRRKVKLSDAGRLLFVLSGMTILWGALTATWFAIPFDSLPGVLRALAVPALSSGNPDSGTNVKIFCFLLGAIQLAVAHMKNIKRDFPNLKFLSQLGSLALVLGMFNAVLSLVIDSQRFPILSVSVGLIGGGFLLVLVFGNWNGNLFRSLLEGLKGIIPTFLGTISVFADIVSYVRLWAVGLAGLAISQTVNGMAVSMIGPAPGRIAAFIFGGLMAVVLIVVGHSINLVMSVLSVIVHGIRLNILEFSSHLGMEWSGYKYEPLCETAEERKAQENNL